MASYIDFTALIADEPDSSSRSENAPISLYWCTDWCADYTPLLLAERSDEFAAEGRDVLDHPAPDQVKRGYGGLRPVSYGLRARHMNSPIQAGVLMGVA